MKTLLFTCLFATFSLGLFASGNTKVVSEQNKGLTKDSYWYPTPPYTPPRGN